MDFAKQKSDRQGLMDHSRKASIDEALLDVVNLINSMTTYSTTSSCSGRIIVIENLDTHVQKKGCKWLYVSHTFVQESDIINAVKALTGEAVFKFEPMIIHLQCQTLESARQMHQAAVAAGFRNSGITVGNKGKIMMAVRSTHSIEAPLSCGGRLLVSDEYLSYLADSANSKMKENFTRIQRFYENIKMLNQESPPEAAVTQGKNNLDKRQTVLPKQKKSAKPKSNHHITQKTHDDNPVVNRTPTLESDLRLFMFDDSSRTEA